LSTDLQETCVVKNATRAYLGRKPSFTRAQLGTVRDILAQAIGIAQIAKGTRLTRHTVYRIKGDAVARNAMPTAWSL
jgi:putative DNA-invertase from lambdoid prophage Rac